MYTNMYEILDSEESVSSEVVKHDSTNENLSNSIIYIDNNLDSCDELLYRSSSGCELMGTEIGSSIDDNLLDENFIKSDSNLVRMGYFLCDSKQKLDEQKSRLFVNHEQLCSSQNEIQDNIIVEDMAEEEVMSEFLHPYETQSENALFEVQPDYFDTFNNVPEILSPNSTELDIDGFQCYKCEKKFRRKKSLEHHIRSHAAFNKPNDDQSHIKTSKTSESSGRRRTKKNVSSSTSQICELCGHCFDNQDRMKEHLRNHKKFKCLHCDRMFWSHMSVTEHSRLEHGIYCGRFVCFYCGKKCKDLQGLEKHSKVHLDGEQFSCNICGKQFYTRNRLRRHLLSHRDKAVICEDCGEKTTDYRALANHRASHHVISSLSGTLTTRTFPCYACNKVFGSRSSQQIHMRIHTGERPYSCKYCVKAFADGGTLRKHERIHTGEKPYVCPICQKAFNQRVVLREHIRAHHAGPNMAPRKIYKCEVCSTICSSPQDLCSHLVKHSDDNTAKQRNAGNRPRKYRKWKNVDQSVEHDATDDQSSVILSAASTNLTDSLKIGDESFCILTDEESLDDVRCGENDFISPPSPTAVEEEGATEVNFGKTNRNYSESSDSSDHCSPFISEMESQKWKIVRRDQTLNDVKSFGDPLSFQLLIPFDDKQSDESIAIRDSSETGSNSYSDTCLNLLGMTDQKSDGYFETNHFIEYAPSKNRLRFSLKEKGDYTFDSDFCVHSGLGLGAVVELT